MSRRNLFLFGPLLLIAAHYVFLMRYFAPAIFMPDANSYFAQARTLATSGATFITKESAVQYVGPHYAQARDGRYYASHAPGLGLILAVPYRLMGPRAAFAVNPLLCCLSLVGLFLLSRRWLGERWAPLPVALLAVNPFLNEHAHFGDAHVAVCFLLVWSLYLLARLESKPAIWAGLAAGVLAGLLPAVRYAEAAYLPAIAWFAWSRRRTDGADRKALAAAAVGASAALVALGLRNHGAYGGFWRTGYGVAGGPALFSAAFLARNAPAFLLRLLGEGGGLTFALAAAAIVLMCRRRSARALGLLCAGIAAPTTLLYMSYYPPPDPQSMRFLLPTFFLYAIATAWLLRRVSARGAALASLLAAHTLWGLPRSVLAVSMLHRQHAALAQAADALRGSVPRGSLVIAPEILNQYLDALGVWRLVDASAAGPGVVAPPPPPPPGRAFPGEGGPGMALDFVRKGFMRARPDPYAGLTCERRAAAFSEDVWNWAGGARRVYWVMSAAEYERWRALAPPGDRFRVVAALGALVVAPGFWPPPAMGTFILFEWERAAISAADAPWRRAG